MLQHLLETASDLAPYRIHVITGHGKEQVMATIEQPESPLYKQLKRKNLDINWVEQSAQHGTGHAVLQAMPHVSQDSTVLILNGDVPLISLATLKRVANAGNHLNLLTATPRNTT